MVHPDKIVRSNRKTLSISVDTFGRLIVRAPKRCKEERIFAFIREKEEWILRKQAQRAEVRALLPPQNLHGYSFLLLGRQTKIVVYDEEKIGYDEVQNLLYLPHEKSRERLVQPPLAPVAKALITLVSPWSSDWLPAHPTMSSLRTF